MKKNAYWRSRYGYLYFVMVALFALCFAACKDDDVQEEAFDPSKPIVITDFMPKKGGFGSNLILTGDNFGNDPSRLRVTVGGKQANILSLKNNRLYCVIPEKAYDGDILISVCDDTGEEIAYAEAEGIFEYEKKWLVSTFIGQRYENENEAHEDEGSFTECGRISKPMWFSFDPKSDFRYLYLTTHDAGNCRLIDLENEYVSFLTQFSKADRPSIINWTADEKKDMVMTRDLGNDGSVNLIYTRESGFKNNTALSLRKDKSATGAVVHPRNGEIYYCTYYATDIWRYDYNAGEVSTSSKHLKEKETIRMAINPTGKYAYMMRSYYNTNGKNNGGYIARMDYIENEKRFAEPYIIAGTDATYGYEDGVGNRVRMQGPGQGVFVKNKEYANEAEENQYDFYFCDELNNCIRVLTPSGRVYTFAGRGNGIAAGGYADGDLRTEARFSGPISIAYDEKRNCFYVGDSGNKVIRKIALEE